MNLKNYQSQDLAILYDGDQLREFTPLIFHRCAIKKAGRVCRRKGGRGETFFFLHRGLDLVHKRYRRGGFYRHFIRETYFFTQLPKTRMWQEFNLLCELYADGLPVPKPVAVCCHRCLGIGYRGDLITERICGAETLAERLGASPAGGLVWHNVGRTIRKFHDNRVNHADLNANNVMIDNQGSVYLIDFDKGRIEPEGADGWKGENLARLLRSLNKLKAGHRSFFFQEQDWEELLAGYHA